MVVFYMFGILLASAAGFDTSGLSPGMVESNLQYVTSQPLPAEEQAPTYKPNNQECPQNELLLKILNILTNPRSLSSLDGNTKSYVLSLLENVLQNSFNNHEKLSNNVNYLRSNPENNDVSRHAADAKKIKITVQYELPASNDCQKSLEYLHKIINVLNETRTAEILNFELRTENPERYNIPNNNLMHAEKYNLPSDNLVQDKLGKGDSLKTLFDNPKSNIVSLLQNYRPDDATQVHNGKDDVSPDRNHASVIKPGINLIPINYDYNGAPEYQPKEALYKPSAANKPDNRMEPPESMVLWKNLNANPLNGFDRSMNDDSNGTPSNDLLKNLLSISKQQSQSGIPEGSSKGINFNLPNQNDFSVQELNVAPYTNQFLNPINNQNHNYDHARVATEASMKFDNYHEATQNGYQGNVDPHLNAAQLQYQPRVDYVNVKQTGSQDSIVEITYVLQQPKTVHYEPVYLIKYRLPLNVFEEAVYKLLLMKPYLKLDQNRLYQELLDSLKSDNRFKQVTHLRSVENNKENGNATEKNNVIYGSKLKDMEDELDIVKELNSNLSSSDLLKINNGTVEDELKRLKRHPAQAASN